LIGKRCQAWFELRFSGQQVMSSSETLVQQITTHAERVAASDGLEVVEVVLRGSGSARLLRITIDKPEG
jgi:ribosome maturation factor RimP